MGDVQIPGKQLSSDSEQAVPGCQKRAIDTAVENVGNGTPPPSPASTSDDEDNAVDMASLFVQCECFCCRRFF